MRDDLVVRDALLRIAVRAPLAHADAVAPAVAGDYELRRPLERGRRETPGCWAYGQPRDQQGQHGRSAENRHGRRFRLAELSPPLRNLHHTDSVVRKGVMPVGWRR